MSKEKTVVVPVNVPVALREAFKACCYGQDTTPSQELRKFMRNYVKDNSQPDMFTKK